MNKLIIKIHYSYCFKNIIYIIYNESGNVETKLLLKMFLEFQ
jgi:hypothetical protein